VSGFKNSLLDGALKLFSGLFFAHLFNLFFQMVMGRLLRPEEFALLASVLGLLQIFTFPMGVFSTALSRYISLLVGEGRLGDAGLLVRYWLVRMLGGGLLLLVVCLLLPRWVGSFFHLERAAPVYVLGIIFLGIFVRPVINGALLGLQRFESWSLCMSAGALVRVVLGGVLVYAVSPFAGWGLLGHGIGFYVTLAWGGWVIWRALGAKAVSGRALPRMEGFLGGSFVVMLGFAVFLSGDVVLVKRLFPEEAATFSYAATLGHLVMVLPSAFVGAMFPKVVGEGAGSAVERRMLWRVLGACLLTAGAGALFLHLTAGVLPRWIFGLQEVSESLVDWLQGVAWAMVPVALLSALMRFGLARNRLGLTLVIPLMSVVFIGFAGWVAAGPGVLILALAVSSLVAVGVLGVVLLRGERL
jgi:O-antigen/teichoic acid export membrane protein